MEPECKRIHLKDGMSFMRKKTGVSRIQVEQGRNGKDGYRENQAGAEAL